MSPVSLLKETARLIHLPAIHPVEAQSAMDDNLTRKLFIPILLGTIRKGRESEKVAKLILERAAAHPQIDTQLFDPREMVFPMDDEGQELKRLNPEWRDAIVRADGLIIISP